MSPSSYTALATACCCCYRQVVEEWNATRGAAAVPLVLQHQDEYMQQQQQAVRTQKFQEVRAVFKCAHEYFRRRRAAAEEAARRLLQHVAEAAAQEERHKLLRASQLSMPAAVFGAIVAAAAEAFGGLGVAPTTIMRSEACAAATGGAGGGAAPGAAVPAATLPTATSTPVRRASSTRTQAAAGHRRKWHSACPSCTAAAPWSAVATHAANQQSGTGMPNDEPWLAKLIAHVSDEDVRQLLRDNKDKLKEKGLTIAAGLRSTTKERLQEFGFPPGHAAAIKVAFPDAGPSQSLMAASIAGVPVERPHQDLITSLVASTVQMITVEGDEYELVTLSKQLLQHSTTADVVAETSISVPLHMPVAAAEQDTAAAAAPVAVASTSERHSCGTSSSGGSRSNNNSRAHTCSQSVSSNDNQR